MPRASACSNQCAAWLIWPIAPRSSSTRWTRAACRRSRRTRNGFYGFTDEEAKPARTGREQQLYGALSSPFNTGALGVRLTTLYGHDAQTGAFMRALLYIDGASLTFKQQPDGTYRSDMDVLAL